MTKLIALYIAVTIATGGPTHTAARAAFIMQQNLMAPNPPPTSARWQERISAYELLTGKISPLAGDRRRTRH